MKASLYFVSYAKNGSEIKIEELKLRRKCASNLDLRLVNDVMM